MASAPVDLVGAEGGFVAAVGLLNEVVVAGAAVDAGVAVASAAAPPLALRPMRWNNNTSRFVLRRMAQLVSDGSRPDKVFKDKDVNLMAKHHKEYTREAVSPTQVYNHLRKWRQKWARVVKLKDLSGALFDHDVNAIMLEPEHYIGHCKVEKESIGFLSSLFLFWPLILFFSVYLIKHT